MHDWDLSARILAAKQMAQRFSAPTENDPKQTAKATQVMEYPLAAKSIYSAKPNGPLFQTELRAERPIGQEQVMASAVKAFQSISGEETQH